MVNFDKLYLRQTQPCKELRIPTFDVLPPPHSNDVSKNQTAQTAMKNVEIEPSFGLHDEGLES
jgi:hypothetical protein